jgi:hypothetical protein
MAPSEFIAWLPVSEGERTMKAPVVEKDAGAEILLWRVHVVDESLGSDLQRVFYHYIRLKIFDEKGKEKASTIDLDYRSPGAILEVSGRTIRPDGSVLELDKKSVYKRDLVRAGGLKQKVVSFAMPGVEPGAIVEYRWKQTEDDNRFRYLRLRFQREFPVQKVTYFVKPLPREQVPGEEMFLMPLNARPSPIRQESDGFSSTSIENIPAARHEPYAPATRAIEPWALLYYKHGGSNDSDKFWADQGRQAYSGWKDAVKVNDDIKKSAAVEAAASAKTDDEKIVAIATKLHASVKSLFDASVTTADREKFFARFPRDRARTSVEILKSGLALPSELNVAFAAMATAAGMEVRRALLADRQQVAFNPKGMLDKYFLDDEGVAVKSGSTWKVLDVSEKLRNPLLLSWEHEGIYALVADPKTPSFTITPAAPPETSVESRTAHFKLSADGMLEGDVEEALSGHRAEDRRSEEESKSPAQRDEAIHDSVVRLFPDAEVTAIKIENFDDVTKPVTIRYHVSAPHYAQVTGKRILFQPIAFQRAIASPFTAADRTLPIEFPYAWKEVDEIHIGLPEGFQLDNAENPGSLDFGAPGSYSLKMQSVTGTKPELQVSRDLTFGKAGNVIFPVKTYPALKNVFDGIQVRDAQTMSLIAK